METSLQLFVSLVVTGVLSLQTLGMLWAAHETRQRYPALQNSWTRLFLVLCWPLYLLLAMLIKRL